MNEINAFVQRLEVARMLKEGATYIEIQIETGASSATITRVKRLLGDIKPCIARFTPQQKALTSMCTPHSGLSPPRLDNCHAWHTIKKRQK